MEKLTFYHPGKDFPSLSVTGDWCSRDCKHCQGHFLRNMVDVSSPKKLKNTAERLFSEGAKGFLLSGGFDVDGKVPLEGYYEVLKDIKQDTDLLINVHTGLLDEDMVYNLKRAGIDTVSYDMIGSKETIKEVYGLNATPKDFEKGFRLLIKNEIDVVPHITLGLHGGHLDGEHRALKMVKKCDRIIINSLIPSLWGKSVSDEEILKFIETASDRTDAELVLGCMRERGRSRLEIKAVKKGIQAIVNPSKDTRNWVKDRYVVIERDLCCCF